MKPSTKYRSKPSLLSGLLPGRRLGFLLMAAGSAAALGACGYHPLRANDNQQDVAEAIH